MKRIFRWIFAGIIAIPVIAAIFGAVVMLLWNALMPQLFALPALNYWQAAGLIILTHLLFGNIGGQHGGHRGRGDKQFFQHENKLREKWMNMNEEERKEFMEKEKDFFNFNRGFSRFNGRFNHEEEIKHNDKSNAKKDESGE